MSHHPPATPESAVTALAPFAHRPAARRPRAAAASTAARGVRGGGLVAEDPRGALDEALAREAVSEGWGLERERDSMPKSAAPSARNRSAGERHSRRASVTRR